MKILVISGLYPRVKEPNNGIFIYQRIVNLIRKGIRIDLLIISHKDSLLIRCLKKLIKRKTYENVVPIKQSNGLNVMTECLSYGVFGHFFMESMYIAWAKKIFNKYKIKYKYNLIHAHRAYPEGYIAFQIHKIIGIPYIITAHGSEIHTLPLIKPKLKNNIIEALNSAKKVIFVSQQLKESAFEIGYSKNNFAVIPNGVDTKIFKPHAKSIVVEKLKIDGGEKKIVGFVGSLISVKRADQLPEIFLKIKSKTDVEFVIVGDGNLKDIIERKLEEYDIEAIFTGKILPNEVASLMNLFDVMILPSRNEGFPCVVLEAQACGCPVVGSNVGGISEAIGDGGMVVEEGEQFEERFAEAVVRILKMPIDHEYLRKRALNFDWSVIVDKEIEVYKSVINNL
ncbi:MAG: glycosyltransferase [Bacillota bacterium]|nr:glycosyltransferase [Bacillota bacterium]